MHGAGIRWLILITFGALVLRLLGIGVLLPHHKEPDTYIVDQAGMLREGGGPALAANPSLNSKYPHLLARLLALVPVPETGDVEKAPVEETKAGEAPSDLEFHLDQAAKPYLYGRIMVALLSVLLVPLTWLLVRRFAGPWHALLAAALIAASLLHVVYSKQARPHAPEATFTLMALLALLKMRSDDRWPFLLFAGVATGAAMGTLQNGFVLLCPLVATFFLRGPGGRKHGWARLVLVLFVAGLFVWMFYPLGGGEEDDLFSGIFQVGGLQRGVLNLEKTYFGELPFLLLYGDPVLLALGLLGIPFLIRYVMRSAPSGERRDLAVLLAFAAPYTIGLGLYGQNQTRYLLPMLPLIAGLSAMGAGMLATLLSRMIRATRISAVLVTVLVLALPLYAAGRLTFLHMRPDSVTMAAGWLARNTGFPRPRILEQPGVSLPLFLMRRAVTRRLMMRSYWWSPWFMYSNANPQAAKGKDAWYIDLLLYFSEKDGSTAIPERRDLLQRILSYYGTGYIVIKGGGHHEPWASVIEHVRAMTERIAEFPVVDAEGPRPARAGYQDIHMLERVLHGIAWGPPIEIYRFGN